MKTLEAIGVHQHSWWFFKDSPTIKRAAKPDFPFGLLIF